MKTKPIKKLVAKEFEIRGDYLPVIFPVSYKYIYLEDPETGKSYEPKPGWEITGEDLTDLFRETANL